MSKVKKSELRHGIHSTWFTGGFAFFRRLPAVMALMFNRVIPVLFHVLGFCHFCRIDAFFKLLNFNIIQPILLIGPTRAEQH